MVHSGTRLSVAFSPPILESPEYHWFTTGLPRFESCYPGGVKVYATESDRRIFQRVNRVDLSVPASIHIPAQPPVSLVDLSSGGALIDLPFQLTPNSRVTIALVTGHEHRIVPFQLLRCYVASLDGGVRYQAAGAFDKTLELPGLVPSAAPAAANQLAATLEAFLRHDGIAGGNGRVREFDLLLASILDSVRRGEPAAQISLEIRSHLAKLIPSLRIEPAKSEYLPDPSRGARFFGMDFNSRNVLTTVDRRLLRAAAQIFAIVNRELPTEPAPPAPKVVDTATSAIAYSIADWQEMCRSDAPIKDNNEPRVLACR